MLTCNEIRPAGTWDAASAVDTVILDLDGRRRRRFLMRAEAGLAFLLDLPRTTTLCEGDGLVLRDGAIVRVQAASERLIEITVPNPGALVRIAWHLGNRHLPTQILEDGLRIRDDHVIRTMIEGLGGEIAHIEAPFDPEGGAFPHQVPDERGHTHEHDNHADPR